MKYLLQKISQSVLTIILGFSSFSLYSQLIAKATENKGVNEPLKEQYTIPKQEPLLALVVTGTVKNEDNQPVPGVSVMKKGTTNGTITDKSGIFSINVKDKNSVLDFSFAGYQSQSITVSGNTTIDLILV